MEYAESFFIAKDNARLINAFSPQPSDSMPSDEIAPNPSDCKRWRTGLKLSWFKNTAFLLPKFKGSLTARPTPVDSERTIEGKYEWLPVAEDASLDIIAVAIWRAATRSLLQQIASHCEAKWIAFADCCPSIAMYNERSAASVPHYARIAL